jgi:hypothetical protein
MQLVLFLLEYNGVLPMQSALWLGFAGERRVAAVYHNKGRRHSCRYMLLCAMVAAASSCTKNRPCQVASNQRWLQRRCNCRPAADAVGVASFAHVCCQQHASNPHTYTSKQLPPVKFALHLPRSLVLHACAVLLSLHATARKPNLEC